MSGEADLPPDLKGGGFPPSVRDKLTDVLLKLIALAFGLGTAFLVLSAVLNSAFTRFMAIGLNLLGGVLLMAYFMLDDIMELREALQSNDLKKLFDMWDRAYDRLTIGGLMFLMAFVFVLAPLISIFGLASYVTAYIFLITAIVVAVLLTDNIYIIKKASPGADKWWEETLKACELELLNKYTTKKDEDNRGGLAR
jgi:zinc transporter ZupT